MKDNRTSQPAEEYDGNIGKTMPYYQCFHDSAIRLIVAATSAPAAWLDTGCGTGTLAVRAAAAFPAARFTLADPSAAMLDIARAKLAGGAAEFVAAGTESLDLPEASFDVITAILAHHYFDAATRRIATANCFRMLKRGGVYVTFETIRPETAAGLGLGLEAWRRAQLAAGKSEADVDKYLKRYGVEFFPITIADHLALLGEVGFAAAEVLWVSGLQAGFYALK